MATLLIIEDSTELQDAYTLIFSLHGIDSTTVMNRDQLFDKVISNKPDAILLDAMLGTEDGREICKELKQLTYFKDIPMILISACPKKAKEFNCCTPDAIIEKPFSIDNLVSTVKDAMNNYRKQVCN